MVVCLLAGGAGMREMQLMAEEYTAFTVQCVHTHQLSDLGRLWDGFLWDITEKWAAMQFLRVTLMGCSAESSWEFTFNKYPLKCSAVGNHAGIWRVGSLCSGVWGNVCSELGLMGTGEQQSWRHSIASQQRSWQGRPGTR